MKKAVCNKGCNQEFFVLKFEPESIRDDIERVGFDCPHCGVKYTAYYTNDKIKELQEQVRALLTKSDPRNHTALQLKGLLHRIDAAKKKIKAEMDNLRKEIETD